MPKKITRRQDSASVPFCAAEHLQSGAEIAAYIEAVLVEGNDRVMPIALRTVREALVRLRTTQRKH